MWDVLVGDRYKNWSIGMAYIMACTFMAWIAGPEKLPDMEFAFAGFGVGVGGIIFGRAWNKRYERPA